MSIYLSPARPQTGQARSGLVGVLDHASNNISLDDEGYWDRPDLLLIDQPTSGTVVQPPACSCSGRPAGRRAAFSARPA